MWYKIAINKSSNSDEDNVINSLMADLELGNESSLGSISVRNYSEQDPETVDSMHLDFDILFDPDPETFYRSLSDLLDHNAQYYENGKFVLRERKGAINYFIGLSNTLGNFIDSGAKRDFQEKLRSFSNTIEDLLVKAREIMFDIDATTRIYKRIREIVLSDFESMSEEEKNRLLAEKEELYKQHENMISSYMSDYDMEAARFIFREISKAIGEMYPKIMNFNGKLQWINDMIKYTIPLNFLPSIDYMNENGRVVEFSPKQLYLDRFNKR